MCSIGEDDFGDEGGVHAMVPERSQTTNDEIGDCKKCGALNVPVFKLYFRDFECTDCFLAYARHKFRATLGSSKVLPRAADVLLVFDGSDAAVVLLDMLYYAQTQNTFKRLHCAVKILCIDESAVKIEQNKNECNIQRGISAFQHHLLNYPLFNSYITAISIDEADHSNVFELKDAEAFLCNIKEREVDFVEKLKATKTLTSRQDLIKYQQNRVIASVAKLLECPFVFLPDISATLATQLLTAISLGRGGSAAYDVALTDERLGENIKIIRPLRDLNQPEIDLYIRVCGLKPFKTIADSYGAASGPAASLQNLTRSFVENLQGNYTSTVSTVFRCCDKIAPKNYLSEKMSSLKFGSENNKSHNLDKNIECLNFCSFCGSPLSSEYSNTLLAIEFSRLVSEKGATSNDCSELDAIARRNLAPQNHVKSLCHACQNIAKDISSTKALNSER